MSISLRGIKRWYCAPKFCGGAGIRKDTRNSPSARTLRPGAVQKFSTATSRRPLGTGNHADSPMSNQCWRSIRRWRGVTKIATSRGPPLDLHAADQRKGVHQTWIGFGNRRHRHRLCKRGSQHQAANHCAHCTRAALVSGMFLTSTTSSRRRRPSRICTMRSVPPASTRAWEPLAASRETASSTVLAAT